MTRTVAGQRRLQKYSQIPKQQQDPVVAVACPRHRSPSAVEEKQDDEDAQQLLGRRQELSRRCKRKLGESLLFLEDKSVGDGGAIVKEKLPRPTPRWVLQPASARRRRNKHNSAQHQSLLPNLTRRGMNSYGEKTSVDPQPQSDQYATSQGEQKQVDVNRCTSPLQHACRILFTIRRRQLSLSRSPVGGLRGRSSYVESLVREKWKERVHRTFSQAGLRWLREVDQYCKFKEQAARARTGTFWPVVFDLDTDSCLASCTGSSISSCESVE